MIPAQPRVQAQKGKKNSEELKKRTLVGNEFGQDLPPSTRMTELVSGLY